MQESIEDEKDDKNVNETEQDYIEDNFDDEYAWYAFFHLAI